MDNYKIAFVLDDSLDTPDGVQQYVLNVGSWFASQGHTVHYIVGETSRKDVPHVHNVGRNIKVRFNQNRMSIPLPVSKRKLRKLLEREEYDIIHVQMPYSPFLGGRVVKSVSTHTGVVGTFHIAPHSRLVHFGNVLLRMLVGGSLGRFDEIISVSKVAQDFAWETFRVESSVVPNTLRLAPFYAPRPFKEYEQSTNIVFFGRLVERKGCQYFLRAIKRLYDQKALPADCKVLVCGKGPLEESLKAYVKQHKLGKLVTFTGFVSEEDKPRYLATGDVIVYPSTGGESFGIVLLEGMAAGRGVVIAGDNPGYAGVLGERPEALFVPTNEEAFANKIQKYLASPKLRQEARDWQQQFVRRFDMPNVADEILVVYEEALRKRRS
ncbi:MAG TPA: glycosyltransferase family 4 protein [Candidatus Saccharimonadales bacterium]|nr:glycosyltransferase family 4 protein [Candidatus Saccharimonadales bacterium]